MLLLWFLTQIIIQKPLSFAFSMKRAGITQFFAPQKRAALTLLTASSSSTTTTSADGSSSTASLVCLNTAVTLDWAPLNAIPESWKDFFETESSKSYFASLVSFVKSEQARCTVYPPSDEIFTAFKLCPLDGARVVIIGQDPYHGPGQAHGLAFSVKSGVDLPPSLRNIFKELREDVGIRAPRHGNLEAWSRQGVVLLNTCLTVRKGEANSHQKRGWEDFTDAAIKRLGSGDRRLVFLLWGKPAQAKIPFIDRTKHTVVTSSHPSPLSAMKTSEPFLGSRCFSRVNAALAQIWGEQHTPIDWNV